MPTIPTYCLAATILLGSLAAGDIRAFAGAGSLLPHEPRSGNAPIVRIAGTGHAAHGPATVEAGDLEIGSFWARAMLPGQPTGGGYLTVTSKGSGDRLLSASSPAAGKVEVHRMEMANDIMVMRQVEGGLEIPAGGTVELKPGGLHLMFMSPSEPFREGESVPVTLQFERAGSVEIDLPVRAAGGDHSAH